MFYLIRRGKTKVVVGGSMKTCTPEIGQGNISDQLLWLHSDFNYFICLSSDSLTFIRPQSKCYPWSDCHIFSCKWDCQSFSCCFVSDPTYTENVFLTKMQNLSSHLGNFFLAACTEAYSQSDEQYACHLGCQNQLPFAELRQEQVSRWHVFQIPPTCFLFSVCLCFFKFLQMENKSS